MSPLRAPLLEITPFCKNWREQRKALVAVAHGIEDGSLPLTVADGAGEIESPVSLEMLKNLIQNFRQIELETQAEMMLEKWRDRQSKRVRPGWSRLDAMITNQVKVSLARR